MIDRRYLLAGGIGVFATYALLREVRAVGNVTDSRLTAKHWINRQSELAHGLREGSVTQLSWHNEIGRLAREVDIAELMAEVRNGRITSPGEPFGHDPVKRNVRFLDDTGTPRKLGYGAAFFTFEAHNVITPHAHKHMVSAHMVVEGKVRIRTFDRIGEQDRAIHIKPSSDHIGGVGTAAAMTARKDNVHWFVPAAPAAMTFDVIIDSLDPGEDDYTIQPLDPFAGKLQDDGSIIAPLISFEESMARYNSKT